MGILIGADWVVKTLALIFIRFFDWVAYSLLYAGYSIFLACSDLNLFGGEVAASLNIYEGFTQRIYSILSIVMVFVFAYQLILMIINPDGDASKASTKIVKDTIISLIAIAVLPTIFEYMTIFQGHVIRDNTIVKMVLGESGTLDDPGKSFQMIVFMSMYHPVGSTYGTFMDNEGNLKSSAVSDCEAGGASSTVCEEWYDGMLEWKESDDASIKYIANREKLREVVNDDEGTEYFFILSTLCALFVAKFIFAYAFDMGTRAVKLGFLEIIAPIPLIFRIFPQTKKTFDTWSKELIKTYLEVFIRLFIIAFIVQLCILVPQFVDVIFNGSNVVKGHPVLTCFATVVLILGLLNFAKQAPDLIKELMNNGGMFNGIDLKPKVTDKIKGNEYAMKGGSAAVGYVAGAAGEMSRRYRSVRASQDDNAEGVSKLGNVMKALGSAATTAPRGGMAGAKEGLEHPAENISISDTIQHINKSVSAAQKEGTLHDNLKREAEVFDPLAKTATGQKIISTKVGGAVHDLIINAEKSVVASKVGQTAATHAEELSNLAENFKGVKSDVSDQTLQLYKTMKDVGNMSLDNLKKETEFMDKAFEDLRKRIAKGETVKYNNVDYKGQDGLIDLAKVAKEEKEAMMKKILNDDASKNKEASTSIANMAKLLEKNAGSVRKESIDAIAKQLVKIDGIGKDQLKSKIDKNETISVNDLTKALNDISTKGNSADKLNAVKLASTASDLIKAVENDRKADEILAAGGVEKSSTKKDDKK